MLSIVRTALQILKFAWASPWTCVGLIIGGIDRLCGGKARRAGRIIEFSGPFTRFVLSLSLSLRGARAMTLGHTVIARSMEDAEDARTHEMVHVRQYERWGPFFGPAYVASTVVQWLRGKDPYFDNCFEREAFDHEAGVTRLR